MSQCSIGSNKERKSIKVEAGEIRCDVEVGISYAAFEKETVRAVSECVVMKDRPRKRALPSSIVICYPSEGDDLWSIAKRYGTTEEIIRKSNDIAGEKPTEKALIIPSE